MVRTDVVLQARNQLYPISVGVSALCAAGLAWLAGPEHLPRAAPMVVLMFVGGSTLLYVIAMIILERDDGTLSAICVSPLAPWQYLLSKVITLTALATLEGLLLVGGAVLYLGRQSELSWPGPVLLLGLVCLGAMHVLVGVVLVVRHTRIMEVLVPMSGVSLVLQLPAFYFLGALPYPALLAVPTGAPTMLVQGAFIPLEPWQWLYGLLGTAVLLAGLWAWAHRAFVRHVVARGM